MVSDSKVRKIIEESTNRARLNTPRPKVLTWCLRAILYELYGYRPNY